MDRGKTIKIGDKEYTLTAKESKVQKIRGLDYEIGIRLEVDVFDVELNKRLSIKEIKDKNIDKYLIEFSKDAFNGLNLLNYDLSDIEDRYKALLQEKITLEDDITHIQIQLETAKDQLKHTGVPADVNWYRKARQALAMKQVELKKLNIYEMELRNERKHKRIEERIKNSNTRAKIFERIAHEVLDQDTFNELFSKVKELEIKEKIGNVHI